MSHFLIPTVFILKEMRFNEGPPMARIHLCERSSPGNHGDRKEMGGGQVPVGGSEHQAEAA